MTETDVASAKQSKLQQVADVFEPSFLKTI